jgi:ATPase subunit of ABC transporter with duplicated ATPase domains
MAGEDTEFLGEAFAADGITVGYLPQEPRLDPNKDVKGNVEEGVAATKALLDRYDELNMKLGEDLAPDEMDKVLEEQGKLQDRIDAVNAWDIDSQLELAMDALRCPPADSDVTTLSGGERRRVEITRALVISPKFMLLDEPFAGIDPIAVTDIQKIIFHLKERGIGVLITDHNVRETLRITDRAYIVHGGVIFRSGTPDTLAADEEVRRIYLGTEFRLD